MSRIRADAIVNRDANGPVVASEGISIPVNKRISVGGSIGTEGQYLGVTSTGLAWTTLAGGSGVTQINSDWTATSGLAQILNKPTLFSGSYTNLTDKPTIPVAYTLPIATSSSLGGIKVGANLTINATTGVLDANTGSYTLPIATSSSLGGIKVGANLTINATTGVLDANTGSSSITFTISASGSSDYVFSGPGIVSGNTNDPVLYLHKGFTYTFVNSTGTNHPFAIRVSNGGSSFTDGVSGSQSGTQIFTVPMNAPSTLYYQCTIHGNMGNVINIV